MFEGFEGFEEFEEFEEFCNSNIQALNF